MMLLKQLVAIKSEGQTSLGDANVDLSSWKWLHCLPKMLGEYGMSSKKSSLENGIENV